MDDFERLLQSIEAEEPGFIAAMEKREKVRARDPFQAKVFSRLSRWTGKADSEIVLWWNNRGRAMNRQEFSLARKQDASKRKRERRSKKSRGV